MISTLACLATAIYFEARGEPTLGQIAVGQVIMTRVYDPRYPDNVCDVVKEGYYYSWSPETPIPNMCQFSFWCDGQPETINDHAAYLWAEEIAWAVGYQDPGHFNRLFKRTYGTNISTWRKQYRNKTVVPSEAT